MPSINEAFFALFRSFCKLLRIRMKSKMTQTSPSMEIVTSNPEKKKIKLMFLLAIDAIVSKNVSIIPIIVSNA